MAEKENAWQLPAKIDIPAYRLFSSHLLQFSSVVFVSFQPSISSDSVKPHEERDLQTWWRQEADHECQCVRTALTQDYSHVLVAIPRNALFNLNRNFVATQVLHIVLSFITSQHPY